jgi:hypothetical protein
MNVKKELRYSLNAKLVSNFYGPAAKSKSDCVYLIIT